MLDEAGRNTERVFKLLFGVVTGIVAVRHA
jgi:hypothetical protein